MLLLLLLGLPTQFVPSESFSEDAQKQAFSAVVRVIDWSDRGGRAGTGVVVGRIGDAFYVLTAHHVVHPGQKLELQYFDTQSYPHPMIQVTQGVSIASTSERSDLALLKIDFPMPTLRPLTIAPVAPHEHGSAVLTIGCSNGDAPTCLVDQLDGTRNLKRPVRSVRFWTTLSRPVVGRSGGPLIAKDGKLLGICRGFLTETKSLPAQGIYATIEEIHRVVGQAGLSVHSNGLVALAPKAPDNLIAGINTENSILQTRLTEVEAAESATSLK